MAIGIHGSSSNLSMCWMSHQIPGQMDGSSSFWTGGLGHQSPGTGHEDLGHHKECAKNDWWPYTLPRVAGGCNGMTHPPHGQVLDEP